MPKTRAKERAERATRERNVMMRVGLIEDGIVGFSSSVLFS